MRTHTAIRSTLRATLLAVTALACHEATAYTLWATQQSFPEPGQFFGPGANVQSQRMFDIVIHNLAFVTQTDFVTPFFNNLEQTPNTCAEQEVSDSADGRLSNGLLINENVDTCPLEIAGAKFLPAVVDGGRHGGQQFAVALKDGEVIMTMDFALDMNVGPKGVTRIPFYGTTGATIVPQSLQTQLGGSGIDQAGIHPSGTVLRGRVGDFNHDGWIDGTLVAAGVLPLDSRFYPGQPFAVQMNFETDIPIEGVLSGNMRGLKSSKTAAAKARTR